MTIKILNVEHGFFAIVMDQGDIMLIDCGMSYAMKPSIYLRQMGVQAIDNLTIQNYDQDHIQDLPALKTMFRIRSLSRNLNVSPSWLQTHKSRMGVITPEMYTLLQMMNNYSNDILGTPIMSRVTSRQYWHDPTEFDDTNNLSVVTFLKFGVFTIIFSGDLERPGWKRHLQNTNFRHDLSQTSVFVASHHGRENGYCREIFDYCSPDIIVISDGPVIYDTQKQLYSQHASGVPFNGGQQTRYVLTTRSDGNIKIDVGQLGGYQITIGA